MEGSFTTGPIDSFKNEKATKTAESTKIAQKAQKEIQIEIQRSPADAGDHPTLIELLVNQAQTLTATPDPTTPWTFFTADQQASAINVMHKYGLHTSAPSSPSTTPSIDHPTFSNLDEWRALASGYLEHDTTRAKDTQDSFWMLDFGALVCQLARWMRELPTVQPFYAMKCNDHRALVELLLALGTGFDCASKSEFETVLQLGCPPQRLIYANPCKPASHCRAAAAKGLSHVTFDSLYELDKIAATWPTCSLVLRLATDDKDSVCEFSTKFGATMALVPALLDRIIELNLNLVGVSFHVGSGCRNPSVFTAAVRDASAVFAEAKTRGIHMNVLDIGGGFPGDRLSKITFEDLAKEIRSALDTFFPQHADPKRPLQVIAEPGRYFAAASHTLVCNIFGKRVINLNDYQLSSPKQEATSQAMAPVSRSASNSSVDSLGPPTSPAALRAPRNEVQYYLNDGVYQSFNCKFFDHVDFTPDDLVPLVPREPQSPTMRSTVFGPTCDALDCILKNAEMAEFHVGEWIFIRNFGAYTRAAASSFNGYGTEDTVFVSCVPS